MLRVTLIFICFTILGCKSEPEVNSPTAIDNGTDMDSMEQIIDVEPADTANLMRIHSLEQFYASLPENAELEQLVFSWPSDNILCDMYGASEGPLDYVITRIKGTNQIIQVSESGAYCQGDSDYYYVYQFDLEGNAIYYYYGQPYDPDVLKFYENGQAILKVEFPAYSEAPSDPFEKPIVTELDANETITTAYFENLLTEYQNKLSTRIESLEAFPEADGYLSEEMKEEFLNDEESMDERANTLELLRNLVDSVPQFSVSPVVIRKPLPESRDYSAEGLDLNSLNVKVYAKPSMNAEVIGTRSYYDPMLYVAEIALQETIEPYGTHTWYKVRQHYERGEEPFEGWVFGAFVAKGIYYKR